MPILESELRAKLGEMVSEDRINDRDRDNTSQYATGFESAVRELGKWIDSRPDRTPPKPTDAQRISALDFELRWCMNVLKGIIEAHGSEVSEDDVGLAITQAENVLEGSNSPDSTIPARFKSKEKV